MDIGFEGSFWCLKKSINNFINPEWIEKENNKIMIGSYLRQHFFKRYSLMILGLTQKPHGYHFFLKELKTQMIFII